jgi:tRNA 2-thiocytidine biosynthesis protein TtcA
VVTLVTQSELNAQDPAKRQQKLHKRLRRDVGRAIDDYAMIEEGDKVMVCVSGGKDSYAMLDILMQLQKSAPIDFEILAVNLDQKQPDFPEHILPQYLAQVGADFHVIERDTYSVVKAVIEEGKTTCGLCSRMRRGTLYRFAQERGITKIALGHHRDDILETLFLNMFHGGKLKAMPARLLSDDGLNTVIRPMAYAREQDIAEYAQLKQYPIIPCNLCGSQDNLQRQHIKAMLQDWEQHHPGRIESMTKSIQNVVPSHLMDTELHNFKRTDRMSNEQVCEEVDLALLNLPL